MVAPNRRFICCLCELMLKTSKPHWWTGRKTRSRGSHKSRIAGTTSRLWKRGEVADSHWALLRPKGKQLGLDADRAAVWAWPLTLERSAAIDAKLIEVGFIVSCLIETSKRWCSRTRFCQDSWPFPPWILYSAFSCMLGWNAREWQRRGYYCPLSRCDSLRYR